MKHTAEKEPSLSPFDLVHGNLWPAILRLSWPMLLIMLFNFAVGFTDIYVAGLIGSHVQAAVGFIEQIYFLFIIMANAVSIGTVAVVSRAAGAGNMDDAKSGSCQSLGIGLITALILSAIGVGASELIVSLIGMPPALFPIAVSFVRIYSLALGFNYMLIISSAILRALGRPEKPAVSMAVFAVSNIFLDFAFVFGWYPFPNLGYRGIPLATGCSVTIGMIINAYFLNRLKWSPFFTRVIVLSWQYVVRILRVSWPMGLVMIVWNAGTVVIYNILGHIPDSTIEVIAAYANGYRIESIIFLPAFALNNAAAVIVGHNLGAGKPDRALRAGRKISVAAAVSFSTAAAVLYIYAGEIAGILAKDSVVLHHTVIYLRYNLLAVPFMAVSLTFGGGLQGAGDTRGVLLVIFTAMWFIRLPLAYLLGITLAWGASGVWTAMITSMAVQGILMTRRFQHGNWSKMQV